MKKQVIATVLSLAIGLSSSVFAFAVNDNSGIQNDLNGTPENATQLGSFNANGFMYTKAPFAGMLATDKGLIPNSQKTSYNDPSFWAIDEVLEASKMNLNNMDIITGYQNDITRREFCSLVMQAYYKYSKLITPLRTVPANAPKDIFTDVDPVKDSDIFDAYYLDVTYGVGNKQFNPNSKITREQIAVMLYRFIEIFDQSITFNFDVTNKFVDDDAISGWAKKEVRTMANREIIKGVGHNRFDPKSNTTKEQSLLLDLRVCKTFLDPQVTYELATPIAPEINGTKLMWNAINDAQNYNVYMYKWNSATEYTKSFVNRTATTSYDLKGLESGTYTFTIKAFNEFNMSNESEETIIYVPSAITNLTIETDSDLTTNGVQIANGQPAKIKFNKATYRDLGWVEVDAPKYRIVVTNTDTNKEVINQTKTNVNYNTSALTEAGNYKVTVYAMWNDFESAGTTAEFEVLVP
jgi:hypothetical protein